MQNETKNASDYLDYVAECLYTGATPVSYEDYVELYTDPNIYLID